MTFVEYITQKVKSNAGPQWWSQVSMNIVMLT